MGNPYGAEKLTAKQLEAVKLRLTNLLSGKKVNGDLIHHALNCINKELVSKAGFER